MGANCFMRFAASQKLEDAVQMATNKMGFSLAAGFFLLDIGEIMTKISKKPRIFFVVLDGNSIATLIPDCKPDHGNFNEKIEAKRSPAEEDQEGHATRRAGGERT